MPKIKELSNAQLRDYQDAYDELLETDPKNRDYLRKTKCIELALHRRDLIGFDLDAAPQKKGFLKKIFSVFKRKK